MSDKEPAPEFLTMDIQSEAGRLRGNLAVPPGEMRLAELAWNVLPLDDRLIALSERRYLASGGAISCKKGCAACCRQVVPVSPPEAWMLADLVAGMPEARRARVLERFATIRETLEENGWKQAFEDRDREDHDELGILNLSYFDFGLPCPFLEDESCSIHPYRPSICREYLVTTSAEHCFEISRPGVQVRRLPVGVWLSRSLARLATRLLGHAAEMELIPLTSALDWAEEHREEGQRRFPARALLEGLLKELGPAREPEPPSTSSA